MFKGPSPQQRSRRRADTPYTCQRRSSDRRIMAGELDASDLKIKFVCHISSAPQVARQPAGKPALDGDKLYALGLGLNRPTPCARTRKASSGHKSSDSRKIFARFARFARLALTLFQNCRAQLRA